jgi:hypothetical protein
MSKDIIGINLIHQEQLVFNTVTNQGIFGTTMGSHKSWKQAQVVLTNEVSINTLKARLVKCHLCLPDGQTIGPHTPFIATLGSGTWVEYTEVAIMDEKGIAHLYLHNSSMLAKTVPWLPTLGVA